MLLLTPGDQAPSVVALGTRARRGSHPVGVVTVCALRAGRRCRARVRWWRHGICGGEPAARGRTRDSRRERPGVRLGPDAGGDRAGARTGQPAGRGDQPLPAAAPGQPGRLAGVGRRGVRARPAPRPARAAVRRLRGMPLVPRDGARVLRGRGYRRPHEPALRQREGRPRGAPRRRRRLHGRDPGAHRSGRLADDRLPHPAGPPLLRRHVLPAATAARHALVPPAAAGDRAGVARAAHGARGRRAAGSPAPSPAGCPRAPAPRATTSSRRPSARSPPRRTAGTGASGAPRSSRRP